MKYGRDTTRINLELKVAVSSAQNNTLNDRGLQCKYRRSIITSGGSGWRVRLGHRLRRQPKRRGGPSLATTSVSPRESCATRMPSSR